MSTTTNELADALRAAMCVWPPHKPNKIEAAVLKALDADDLDEAAGYASVEWHNSAYGFGFINEATRLALEAIEDTWHLSRQQKG